MAGGTKRELRVTMTDAEFRALRLIVQGVVEIQGERLERLVGKQHNQIKAAVRMRDKLLEALEYARRVE